MWEFDVASETWSCLSVSSVSTNDAEKLKHLKGRLGHCVRMCVSTSGGTLRQDNFQLIGQSLIALARQA